MPANSLSHPALADLKPGSHLCALYETEEEQRALLAPFLWQGLERGEKVLYFAHAHTPEAILDSLRHDGRDPEPYLKRGQLKVATTDSVYLRDGPFDPDRMIALLRAETERALAEGYSALRVTGEMTWALENAAGAERLIEYESKLNTFFPGSRCLALCQYDCRRFSAATALDVLRTHPLAVVGGEVYDNFFYVPPDEFLSQDAPAAVLRHRLRNLQERKQIETELRRSRDEWELTFNALGEAISIHDLEYNVVLKNRAFAKLFPDDEGRKCYQLVHELEAPPPHCPLARMLLTRRSEQEDFFEPAIGRHLLVRADPVLDENGEIARAIHVIRDITDSKRMEQELERRVEQRTTELKRTLRALRVLSECNQTVVRAQDEGELLAQTCRIFVEVGGYRLAWIGFKESDEQKIVRPVAQAGFERGYLQTVNITWADTPRGRGPTGSAIRTRRPVVARNIAADLAFEPWREEAVKRGFASAIALPLLSNGDCLGALNIYAAEPDAFDEQEEKLLAELAADLSYGIAALRARVERQRAEAALQRSEASLAKAQRIARLGSWEWEIGGNELRWSDEIYRIFGVAPEAFGATYEAFLGFVHPDDRESVQAAVATALAERKPYGIDHRILRADGSERIVHEQGEVACDEAERAVRMVGTVQDITEVNQLEEQLRQAQKMEAVGRLAGGVAHDFNNVLMVIKGYGELLTDHLSEQPRLQSMAKEIEEASERAAGLVGQLLAFSRKQVLQPRVLDLNAVVANTDKMLRRLIGEDIELVSSLRPGLGPVRADPAQLEQVIMNLAVNARDAMPQGGKLTIETAEVVFDEDYARQHFAAAPGSYVMLAISDTGAGMVKETLSHIFEPFFTTKEKGKGTGLGLATVYGIVKQSNGFIWVYSEPGHGTTFKVYLPRVTAAVDLAVLPRPVGAERPATQARTVLLVEDEDILRGLMREFLQQLGCTVLDTGSSAEALRLAREHGGPIDLLITDVVMPGMSGGHLARELVRSRPQMRVLYTSGYPDETIVRHGVLEPGTHFLQKPFSLDLLARKMDEALRTPQADKTD
jgi:PAS domain S-box-containing protein